MLLTVTDDRILSQKIRELCALSGMFSYIRGFNDAKAMTNLPKAITSILIDGRFSKQNVRELYAFVMDNYPDIAIAVLTSEDRSSYKKFYQIIPVADQLIMPVSDTVLARFILEFYFKNAASRSNDLRLQINRDRKSTALLGYCLELTPSEHRILLLLASFADVDFSASEICELCLKSDALSSVPVHICSINKKSSVISARNIIISDHNGSYRINKNM